MNTFIIDESEFEEDVLNNIGTLYKEYYNDNSLSYFGKNSEGMHVYRCDIQVDENKFFKYIRDNHERETNKRKERMRITMCKIIKLDGEYYILDGDEKIRLYDLFNHN